MLSHMSKFLYRNNGFEFGTKVSIADVEDKDKYWELLPAYKSNSAYVEPRKDQAQYNQIKRLVGDN